MHHVTGPLGGPASDVTQEPVGQVHHFGAHARLPVTRLIHVLDCMADDAALLIELEDEEAREPPFLARAWGAAQGVVELVFALLRQARIGLGLMLVRQPPLHHQLFAVRALAPGREVERLRRHALRQDLQLEVPNDGDPVPSDGRCPQRRHVGDAARHGGEVWMGRGEEVEGDVGRQDFLRQRRLEERRQAFLEYAQSYPVLVTGPRKREKEGQHAYSSPASLFVRHWAHEGSARRAC